MDMSKKTRNKFLINTSLSRRLLYGFFIVAAPVLAAVFLISFIIMKKSDMKNVCSEQEIALTDIARQFEKMTEDTKSLSRDLIFNESIQRLLLESISEEGAYDISEAIYFLNNFIANRDFVESVVLAGTDRTLVSTEKAYTNVSRFDLIQEKDWYRKLQRMEKPYLWTVTEDGLMISRKIYSREDYVTLLGYEMIYLRNEYVEDIWKSCKFGETTNIILMDEDGNVLLTNEMPDDYSACLKERTGGSMNQVIVAGGTEYVMTGYSFSSENWMMYMITPFEEVNVGLKTLRTYMLILVAVIAVIFLMISATSAKAMARPIVRLADLMDGFHGKEEKEVLTDVPAYQDRLDEVGRIYRSYQNMTERTDTLIEEVYIKTLEKKNAELALLQSQINPHFLYNTLNTINWMAMANGEDEISEMVVALSNVFRLSLTKNNDQYVSVKYEIEYLTSYMTLQKFRYNDRLTVYFDVEKKDETLKIPKYVCQPIVENALKHGIDALRDGGDLFIQMMRTETGFQINVINDGVGIDLEKVQRMLEFEPDNMEYLSFEKEGYGLQNIQRRIRIMCGEAYGIRFREIREEEEAVKTVCTVTLPLKEE